MDEFEKLIRRRSAHELLMRPRGFNWHRLRLVKDRKSHSTKDGARRRIRIALPTPLELLLSFVIAAALVAAYFWWERSIGLQ